MAAAVPFALKGGSMLMGSLLGKKLGGPSKEQKAAMTQTQQSGNALNAYARPMMAKGFQLANQGQGDLSQASNYYRNILGNRQAARESLAPEMNTAMEFYRGATNQANRTLRGGRRDYAVADLKRQQVAQMAGMLPAARANAARGIADVGGTALSGGTSFAGMGGDLASQGAYINSGLFNQATQIRNQQGEAGKGWGSLLYDIAGALPWGKKAGGGGGWTPVPDSGG